MSKLSEFARSRFAHAQAKKVLKEKYEAKLTFAHAGGLWKAGPELLVLLKAVDGNVVLLDQYSTPVQVNAEELYNLAYGRWTEQMNAWLVEHNELMKQR